MEKMCSAWNKKFPRTTFFQNWIQSTRSEVIPFLVFLRFYTIYSLWTYRVWYPDGHNVNSEVIQWQVPFQQYKTVPYLPIIDHHFLKLMSKDHHLKRKSWIKSMTHTVWRSYRDSNPWQNINWFYLEMNNVDLLSIHCFPKPGHHALKGKLKVPPWTKVFCSCRERVTIYKFTLGRPNFRTFCFKIEF